jgi:hypothetical protein
MQQQKITLEYALRSRAVHDQSQFGRILRLQTW